VGRCGEKRLFYHVLAVARFRVTIAGMQEVEQRMERVPSKPPLAKLQRTEKRGKHSFALSCENSDSPASMTAVYWCESTLQITNAP